MKYNPCIGACTDTGTHCDGCGRTHEDVAELNRMVKELAAYAKKMNYENIDDYTRSVANSINYKLESLNNQDKT